MKTKKKQQKTPKPVKQAPKKKNVPHFVINKLSNPATLLADQLQHTVHTNSETQVLMKKKGNTQTVFCFILGAEVAWDEGALAILVVK